MQFNVSSLLKEPTGSTREYAIDDGHIAMDGGGRAVSGAVRFDRTPRGIFVRAHLDGEMSDVCSRCLKPITFPVRIEIEEEYLPLVDVVTGTAVAAQEGDEDAYRISANHILDLAVPAQQYWALALPMAPLCSENCPGLCPLCGEEISMAGHTCTREQVDARWSKLANLKLG
jgi:uncharacterized protein